MKLLFEANLSRRLLRRLDDFFSGSIHVQFEGLGEGPDREIWDFAGANGFVLVTADADFFEMASTLGPPPKAISLKGCDYPTAEAECGSFIGRLRAGNRFGSERRRNT